MRLNVIDDIVKNDLCIGCGVCAGICPQKILNIEDNKYGEYVPSETKKCNSNCGLCLDVCPFSSDENETQLGAKIYGDVEGIKYLSETGYYLDSSVGYSYEFREKGASGGLATWLLTKLLREGFVDYVVCPVSQGNPEKLFDFEILSDENSVRAASGSVYYPVEMSAVVQKILQNPGRYAVTGLPCFIKALRLAAKKNGKLRERIVFTIGLVCGQLKSKHYTEYIATLAGYKGSRSIQSIYYRGKSPDEPASNFYFRLIDDQGSQHRLFWDDGMSEAWVNRWFTPNACNFCDDVFAELADITFMDAWLSEYSRDSKGTNLALVRLPEILDIVQKGIEKGEINVSKISVENVIHSQVGVIELKRKKLSYRVYLAKEKGKKVPAKRVNSGKGIGIITKLDVKLKARMQERSRTLFLECNQNHTLDVKAFRFGMHPYIKQIDQLRLLGMFTLPIITIKRISKRKE